MAVRASPDVRLERSLPGFVLAQCAKNTKKTSAVPALTVLVVTEAAGRGAWMIPPYSDG